MTPFEVCSGFNSLIPLTMTFLSSNIVVNLDASKGKIEILKIHSKVKETLEKNNSKLVHQNNHGIKKVVLRPGDWLWVFFQKERFLHDRKENLSPRGDDLFKVLERINENAFKIDLPSEHNVHNVFNISHLSSCVVGSIMFSI